jgi:hypothetical protein
MAAWLKTRRSDVKITVTTVNGSVEVDVHNARPDQIMPLLVQVTKVGDD